MEKRLAFLVAIILIMGCIGQAPASVQTGHSHPNPSISKTTKDSIPILSFIFTILFVHLRKKVKK